MSDRLCDICGDYKELCGHDFLYAEIEKLKARIALLEAENDRYRNGYKGGCWTCESVGELNVKLEAENARLREAVDLVILKHRVRKERGTLVYFELPSEELEALAALLGGGEK